MAVESGYIRSQCGSELEMDVVLFLGPAPDPEERSRHVLIIGSLPYPYRRLFALKVHASFVNNQAEAVSPSETPDLVA